MFRPHKGMLYKRTDDNIELYEKGLLQPVTVNVTAEKYFSLHGRFHAKSKTKSWEKSFRDLSNCIDLDINSSIAEQRNAVMAWYRLVGGAQKSAIECISHILFTSFNRYFVSQMGLSNFQIVSRLCISLRISFCIVCIFVSSQTLRMLSISCYHFLSNVCPIFTTFQLIF